MDIDAFLAQRVRELRKARALTLDALAERSGVSRSMISLIERQETSPTAAVLNKLADAFGIALPTLFAGEHTATPDPVSRRAAQVLWTDPASGYTRRHLSPTGIASPIELVEVCFPANETVVFDNPTRQAQVQQQLWLIEGVMDIGLGLQHWQLGAGDCLALTLGERITFHNPGPQTARYVLALSRTTEHPWRTT